MIQRIATVAVYVEDQDRALEFWRDLMGFEVRAQKSMGRLASGWRSRPREPAPAWCCTLSL